jgi:hypothetical protein
MKRYNNYVFENKYGSKSITEEEFDKLLSENCKNLTKFYRGIRDVSVPFMYQDSIKEKRTSIEEENIHVVLMSELPSWEDYPKYDKAIVCSTSQRSAGGYYYNNSGGLYEVYPYDNIKIGLCDSSCVWNSFGGFYDCDSIRMTHNLLNRIFEYSSKEHDWEYIKKQIYNTNEIEWLELWDYLILYDENGFSSKFADYFEIALNSDYGYMFTAENIIEFIEHTFDPDVNGFKMMINDEDFYFKFQNYFDDLHEDHIQVWFEGPALLKKIS